MKKQITFIIFVFTILSTNSFAQFLTVYSGKEGTTIVKGQGTANGGTYTYEATIKSKFEAKILGEFWIYLSIPEFKITGFKYKGKDAAYFVDSSFPISPKGNFQSKISGDYRLSDEINNRIAGNSFVEGGVGQSMDMITFIDIDNDNKTALKQYLNGDKSKLANIKAQLSKLSLKNDYFEELSAIGRLIDKKIQNENQIKNQQKQENTVDNKTTKISNTNDDFWNGASSNNNSNSQIQQYSQTNNNYNTNTSGLTKEQIKAQENFKQNQQEQMQYVQNKIAENRQNAQNIQNAADATELEWKNGNYIQGSSHLANEYAKQGNEEAAIGTLAVGVGLDVVSSIQANREKRKAEEAQIRKIEDAKKIAFEKEKVRREKFVESHENTILKLIKDGTSIFDISTKTEKIELYGRILDYDVASFQLAKENHQFDYFYITFVQAVQYDGKGYDNYTPGAYLFHSNIKPKSILYYSNPIKFPMEFIKNKNDLGVFLMNLDNLHPAAKYNGSELDRNILYFHTSENTFNNLINQKNTFYNNLNIFFEKKTTSQVYENFAKNYGEIRTELNNIESNIETIDTGEIYKLANAYYKGQGVNKDLKRAEDLYTQAAENGNVEAMVGLGHLYVVNITPLERQLYGVPWDAVKSFYWYEKAAEAGHVESMVIVGNYTYAGKETPKDFSKAVIWYNKAIEKGSLEAMYELGDRYFYKSDEKAFFYWQQAAEKEHLPSIKRLGEMYSNLTIQYFKGDSKKFVKKHKNIEKAFFWYKKACDLGDNNSCETLKYLKI